MNMRDLLNVVPTTCMSNMLCLSYRSRKGRIKILSVKKKNINDYTFIIHVISRLHST